MGLLNMKDQEETREQLVNELWELHQRIAELEAFEEERKRVEKALRGERWVTGASTWKYYLSKDWYRL